MMTEQETASADDVARLAAEAEIARAAAEAENEIARLAALAKAQHADAIAALSPGHDGALATLDSLRSQLQASFAKATAEPDHVAYAQSFVRDVQLKAAEIVAWIQRHV
jgi:hypothetical protein